MRKRKIKQYGNSIAIELNKKDLIDLGWVVGDTLDIEDCYIINDEHFPSIPIKKQGEKYNE